MLLAQRTSTACADEQARRGKSLGAAVASSASFVACAFAVASLSTALMNVTDGVSKTSVFSIHTFSKM